MNSIIPVEFSIKLYIFINFIYIVVVAFFWRNNITRFDAPHKEQPFLVILVLFHLIFAYDGGDTYHYAHNLASRKMDEMEPVYTLIASIVNYNYLLFRLIVWGGALLLFLQTTKRFCLDQNKCIFVLYVMFITIFDYARATLAMSVFFFGASFLCKPIRHYKVISYIIGFLIILLSILFHRSMLFPVIIVNVIFLHMTRRRLYVIFIIFLLSGSFLSNIVNQFIGNLFMADDVTIEKVARISEMDFNQATEARSLVEHIRQIVEHLTFILPLIILSIKIFSARFILGSPQIKRLYMLAVSLVMMSFIILLVRIGNYIVYVRFLYMAMIPVVILLVYGRKHNLISDRVFKTILVISILNRVLGVFKLVLGGNFS